MNFFMDQCILLFNSITYFLFNQCVQCAFLNAWILFIDRVTIKMRLLLKLATALCARILNHFGVI